MEEKAEFPTEGIDLLALQREREGEPIRYKPMMAQTAQWISSPEAWRNWENDDLVEAERMIRSWMEEMCKLASWRTTNAKCRKYTFAMVFEIITGERYEQRKHARYIKPWTTILRYYSSRVQKSGMIDGRFHSKTVYVLSPARLKRPPYSLRLRIPWLIENGVAVDRRTMLNLDGELLEPGHARSPRTDENMRRRREEGRKRYERRTAGDPGAEEGV